MSWFKKRYNKRSAKKYGWHPSWFAAYLTDFNQELLDDWNQGQYCAGLFDGTTPEFDTVSVGRYDTDELPL